MSDPDDADHEGVTHTLDGHATAAPSYQLREFMTYAAAEGIVERLTDNDCPIDRTSIVGGLA